MKVTVVDYGVGNMFSVCRALECCGATVALADSPTAVQNADRLVLPGVGAFRDGMEGLASRRLVPALWEYACSERPLLGICLGMQMLLDGSEEFGEHQGLGLLPGKVVPIPNENTDGQPLRIPHIGWNAIQCVHEQSRWDRSPLSSVRPGEAVYFVHSYNAMPAKDEHWLAECEYGGHRIRAAIGSGSTFGCQFHPEKSGPAGLRILTRFLQL